MLTYEQRAYGLYFGSILGDALGAPYEFLSASEIEYTHILKDGGPFNLKAGQWTDDTSMMLALSQMLVKYQGHNLTGEMLNYDSWRTLGYLSSTGTCFDIGNQTEAAIIEFMRNYTRFGVSSYAEETVHSGNGALMRITPVPLICKSLEETAELATQVSITTHNNTVSTDACTGFAAFLWVVLNKQYDKQKLLSCPIFEDLSYGSCTGYSWDSYQLALESFKVTESFEECMAYVISKGGDTDTNACIAGMLAGAYYGLEDHTEMISQLAKLDLLNSTFNSLLEFSK